MFYKAIDFETADRTKASACAVGLVEGDGTKIGEEYYTLIRPPRMVFSDECIRIHQIHPADVENAPEFPALWKKAQNSNLLPKNFPECMCMSVKFQRFLIFISQIQILINHYDSLIIERILKTISEPIHFMK